MTVKNRSRRSIVSSVVSENFFSFFFYPFTCIFAIAADSFNDEPPFNEFFNKSTHNSRANWRGETSKLLAEKAAPYINRVTGPFSHLDEYESLTKNRALIRIALMVFFESLENASHRKRCKNVERRNVQRVPAWYARAEDYFTRENKSRS